jgi:molybdopterin synthase catalytic subunit
MPETRCPEVSFLRETTQPECAQMNQMNRALAPPDGDDWIAVSSEELPVDVAWRWATVATCGGVVTFCGTVRDHSDGRSGVTSLEYEAYEEYVVPQMADVASTARLQWPALGRLVLLHRLGMLTVGDVAVVVAASAPHRGAAFAAAEHCIDAIKRTVPIWKRETWPGGSVWVQCDHEGLPDNGAATSTGTSGAPA